MSTRILTAGDDPGIAEMLALLLEPEGFEVNAYAMSNDTLPFFRADRPDLVLLDVMLPGPDGVSTCRLIREESGILIIIMSTRTDPIDVIAGLEADADDYVTRPSESSVLLARVKARLRRQELEYEVLRISDLVIDLKTHQAQQVSKVPHLALLEFELLSVLVRKPWQASPREELLKQVQGYRQSLHDPRVVNIHMQRLYSEVEHSPDHPEVVLVVRGIGYRADVIQE